MFDEICLLLSQQKVSELCGRLALRRIKAEQPRKQEVDILAVPLCSGRIQHAAQPRIVLCLQVTAASS